MTRMFDPAQILFDMDQGVRVGCGPDTVQSNKVLPRFPVARAEAKGRVDVGLS